MNTEVLWHLADVEMRLGRFEAAQGRLLRALSLDLDRPRFLLKLGECYLEMGRPAEAAVRLQEALAENPTLATAAFHLGLAYEESGRPAAAAAAYRRELAAHPDAYRASFNLAKLLLARSRAREAIPFFQAAVEVRPGFGTGHLYLAKAQLDAGDLAAAEASARRGLESGPDSRLAPVGHYVLADVYARLGRPRDAAREAAAARRLERIAGRG